MIYSLLSRKPSLTTNGINKYLSLDKWLNEIVFCNPDEERYRHTLTREQLIFSARDKDGGGHYDLEINIQAYILAKLGKSVGTYGDQELSTQNYSLIMLRQIGFEILNSQQLQALKI